MRFLIFIFLLVFCFPFLERYIFFTEIFSLLGILFFPIWMRYRSYKMDRLEICVALFVCYQLALFGKYLLLDLKSELIYGQLRTLTIMYSVFCFYFGSVLFNRFSSIFLSVVRKYRLAFFIILLGAWRVTAVPATALLAKTSERVFLMKYLLFFVFLFIVGGAFSGHNTLTYFIMVLGFLVFSMKKTILKVCLKVVGNFKYISVVAALIISLLYYVRWYFQDFYTIGYSYFAIQDVNSLWRLMLWALTTHESIERNFLFGIGFGTPLFNVESSSSEFIVGANPRDQWLPYTLGLHNSFLYAFVRLGVFGLGLFLLIFSLIVKKCRLYLMDKIVYVLTISFILLNVGALLNVVLESPLASSLYWILAGGIHGRAVYLKQYVNKINNMKG